MIEIINIGATANDGTGDKLRDAMIIINENFQYFQDNFMAIGATISISQVQDLQNRLNDIESELVNIGLIQEDIDNINLIISNINLTLNNQNLSILELQSDLSNLIVLVNTKIGEAPIDGNEYVRKNGSWQIKTEQTQLISPTESYVGSRLIPTSATASGFLVDRSVNGRTGYEVYNTNTGNGAVSAFVAGNAGYLDQLMSMQYFGNNYFLSFLRNRGAIYSTNTLFNITTNNGSFIWRSGSDFNNTSEIFQVKQNKAIQFYPTTRPRTASTGDFILNSTSSNRPNLFDGTSWRDIAYLSDITSGGWTVVSSSITAVNDTNYSVVANSTFTDPSPVEGKGYHIKVVNGTATVGSIGYGEGRIITRTFHSGSWRTKVYVDETIVGAATQTALNLKENLSNKVTSITGATGTYPDTPTVKNYVDLQESAFGVKNRFISVLTIQTTVTNATISTNANNTNERVIFVPFRIGEDINIKNIAMIQNAENNGASSTLTFYIYNDSNDGLPGIKLFQVISSTGILIGAQKVIDLSVNWDLPRGNYWIGVHPRGLNTAGTNPTFVGGNVTWNSILEDNLIYTNNRNSFLNIANQSADLGDNPILTISTTATINLPQIYIKS